VRRHPPEDLALPQRLADQAELVVLQITKPAVDQLRRGRGGAGGEVVLLTQEDGEAPSGGLAGDPATVDPTAHDGNVEAALRCAHSISHQVHFVAIGG